MANSGCRAIPTNVCQQMSAIVAGALVLFVAVSFLQVLWDAYIGVLIALSLFLMQVFAGYTAMSLRSYAQAWTRGK